MEQGRPELFGVGCRYGAAAHFEKLVGSVPQHGAVVRPGEQGLSAQFQSHREEYVREAPGVQVVQRVDHRLLKADHLVAGPRFGDIVSPILQVDPVGQDQVGQAAGVVEERREADYDQVVGLGDGVIQPQ